MSVTLSGKEIRDLAQAAGFEISDRTKDDKDLLFDDYVVQVCPKEGVIIDNGWPERKHYSYIAYCLSCPEEGCFPLGNELDFVGKRK